MDGSSVIITSMADTADTEKPVAPVDGTNDDVPSCEDMDTDEQPAPTEHTNDSGDKDSTVAKPIIIEPQEKSDDSVNVSPDNADDDSAVMSDDDDDRLQICNGGDTATDAATNNHSDHEKDDKESVADVVGNTKDAEEEKDDEGDDHMSDEDEVNVLEDAGNSASEPKPTAMETAPDQNTESPATSSISPRKTPKQERPSRNSVGSSKHEDDSDVDDIDVTSYDTIMEDFEVDNDSSPVKSSPMKAASLTKAGSPTKAAGGKRKKKKKKHHGKIRVGHGWNSGALGVSMENRPPSVIVDEKYFKPFDYGWHREVVIRNTYDEVTKSGKTRTRPADVYYFAPTKQKLRSKMELMKHLEKCEEPLTVDHFTFLKEPIHQEPYEVVRMAGFRHLQLAAGKSPAKSSPQTTPKAVVAAQTTPNTASPGRSRRKVGRPPKFRDAADGSEVLAAISAPTLIRAPTLGRPRGPSTPIPGVPSSLTPRPPNLQRSPVPRGPTSLLSPPALTCRPSLASPPAAFDSLASLGQQAAPRVPARAVAKKHTGKRSASGGLQRMPAEKRRKLDGEDRLCGMECEGRQGVPPSLHCQVCMCMFHPECVGRDPMHSIDTAFACQSCSMVKSSIQISSHRAPSTMPFMNPSLPLTGMPPSLPLPGISPSCPPPLKRAPNKPERSPMANGDMHPPMRYISRKSEDKVSGQLLTLPASVTSKLNLNQPLQLKMAGQTFIVPPSCFLNGPDGVKVLLPNGSLAKANGPLNVKVQSLCNGATSTSQTTVATATQSENANKLSNASPSVSETSVKASVSETPSAAWSVTCRLPISAGDKPQRVKTLPADSVCHFHKLHAGFDCMFSILEHLSIPDLLSVSQVCKTWQKLASLRFFWCNVSLSDVKVTDWSAATKRFQLQQTTHLDMRRLVHAEGDRNRTWHELTASLPSLQSLRSLRFGHCPANILYTIAEKLTGLESLTAEFITDCPNDATTWPANTKLDVAKLSSLGDLKVLKLRAMCGLELPAFSLSGGLTQLATLTNLTTLCLTTLRNVADKEFTFIGSLVNLTWLELGDCNTWTEQTYQALGKLFELKRLKLVAGGQIPDAGLGNALTQLHSLRHLELIKYVIASNLAEVLPTLTDLNTLCVWPDTHDQVALTNRHTMTAVSKMSHLRRLEWGILGNGEEGDGTTSDNNNGTTIQRKIECIPMSADVTSTARADETGESCDVASTMPATDYVSITKVMEELCCHLATTKINMFCVPTVGGQT